jgi:clostripain
MYYAAGCNSSEIDLLSDVDEMIRGKQSEDYEVILLIDRTEGHSNDSTTLGENFTDTRLYRINKNSYEELNGKELLPELSTKQSYDANMADAHTLKQFIRYCKTYYPADHYMLVMRSHGNGLGMCPDSEHGVRDKLYPGEMSDILTKAESVDILGLDVCSMAGLENLYEWRPGAENFGAEYVIASAPVSAAWAYDQIFGRLKPGAIEKSKDSNYFSEGIEEYLDPNSMRPIDFAKLIMEEIYDNQPWASWGLFDNSKIVSLKLSIDDLSKALVDEPPELIPEIIEQSLGYYHNAGNNLEEAQLTLPYLDAYDFFNRLTQHEKISNSTIEKAKIVCDYIDQLVLYSYFGRGFFPDADNFKEGKGGSYIILPNGARIFSSSGSSFWSHTTWYHPADQQSIGNAYGKYDWCIDGATPGNQKVENFFEFLDYLFDPINNKTGGVNKYQW